MNSLKSKFDIAELRKRLKHEDKCVFLDRSSYCELAISNRLLVRADWPEAAIRGMMEPDTGRRFLIEDEKLFVGL